MTRKHFIALAKFAANSDLLPYRVFDLAALCSTYNPDFSEARFVDAVYAERSRVARP